MALLGNAGTGFNSQPPEGGWVLKIRKELRDGWFQLTAARRRLAKRRGAINPTGRFNSQPPEGGWARPQLNRRLG